jgi:DNA/RNA endonuclease YhcR with UshA esterase domain
MKNALGRTFAIAAICLALAGAAVAHHGTANYDMTKEVTVKGAVANFQFINPHVEIFIDVKDDKGNVQQWQAETNSPNLLHRAGWTKDSLKRGDVITVSGNRAKDGSNVMRLNKVVLSDGKELPLANGSNIQ